MTATQRATPSFTWQALTLKLRVPFRLSYGVTETRRSFWIRLAGDEGWGEAAIPPYYGVSDESMIAVLAGSRVPVRTLARTPHPKSPAWIGQAGPAPARCALDLALHDRLARQAGLPVWQLLGLPRPVPSLPPASRSPSTNQEEMARQAAEVARSTRR